jgi:hypothetical protein
MEIARRNTCRESIFWVGDSATNGPRPTEALTRDTPATIRREKANPPEPRRTAAHSRSGRGAKSNATNVAGPGSYELNTRMLTASSPSVRNPNSPYRWRPRRAVTACPATVSKIRGGIVMMANTFARTRCRHASQKSVAQPVSRKRETASAQATAVAPKAASRMNVAVFRRLSNRGGAPTTCRTARAPRTAWMALLATWQSITTSGTLGC